MLSGSEISGQWTRPSITRRAHSARTPRWTRTCRCHPQLREEGRLAVMDSLVSSRRCSEAGITKPGRLNTAGQSQGPVKATPAGAARGPEACKGYTGCAAPQRASEPLTGEAEGRDSAGAEELCCAETAGPRKARLLRCRDLRREPRQGCRQWKGQARELVNP